MKTKIPNTAATTSTPPTLMKWVMNRSINSVNLDGSRRCGSCFRLLMVRDYFGKRVCTQAGLGREGDRGKERLLRRLQIVIDDRLGQRKVAILHHHRLSLLGLDE